MEVRTQGAKMHTQDDLARGALTYLRGLPSRDGWTRPDPARLPLTIAKEIARDGLIELRAVGGGAHDMRITPAGFRMLTTGGALA